MLTVLVLLTGYVVSDELQAVRPDRIGTGLSSRRGFKTAVAARDLGLQLAVQCGNQRASRLCVSVWTTVLQGWTQQQSNAPNSLQSLGFQSSTNTVQTLDLSSPTRSGHSSCSGSTTNTDQH